MELSEALKPISGLPETVIVDYAPLADSQRASRPRGGVVYPFKAKVLRLNTNRTSVYVTGPKDQVWQFRLSDGSKLGFASKRGWHITDESLEVLRALA